MRNKGVVYIAFSNKTKHTHLANDHYINEAIFSAKSIKKLHPKLHITLFSDIDPQQDCFDAVKIVAIDCIRVKQELLLQSPYKRTLYLDSDTGIVGPIEEVFDLLDRFDLAATHDLMRKDKKKSDVYPEYSDIPDGFSELAGGVILFKKSKAITKFFSLWKKNYKSWCKLSGTQSDQAPFRVSVWQSDVALYILPPEYNIRTKKYDNITQRVYHHHNMYKLGIVS